MWWRIFLEFGHCTSAPYTQQDGKMAALRGLRHGQADDTTTNDMEDHRKELASLSQELQEFLKRHGSLNYIGSKKVRCSLTGHEMPCKMTALESYTKGRKYQRLRERSCCDLEKYKPHIIPSQKKGHVHQLFCTLTRRHISREPADIERHVKGKRYMRALTRYNECQRLGVPFKPCSKVPRMDRQQQELDHGPREGSTTDSEASDGETDDSMSDLYPAEDFEDELEDAGLEEDIENMAVGDASKNAEQVTVGKKRKNPGFTKKTTFKKSKQLKLNPEQQQMFKDAR